MQEPRVSGEGVENVVLRIAGGLVSLIYGLLIAAVPLALIALDLLIGAQFIDSYAADNGRPLSGVGNLVPFAGSAATTGLQYGLFGRLRYGVRGLSKTSQLLLLIAGLVAVGDTLIDIGGITSWRHSDAEAANIIPSQPDAAWWLLAVLGGGLCLLHEPMLRTLLARFEGQKADEKFTAAVFIGGGVTLAGWSLTLAKAVALPLGALAMIFLDIVLTPQIGTNTTMVITMWITSLALTGFQLLLWEHRDNVGIRRLSRSDKACLAAAWVLAAIDTVLDVLGYTTAIYGDGTRIVVIPDSPSWVWGLGAFITGTVCFAGERLFKEVVLLPKKERAEASPFA